MRIKKGLLLNEMGEEFVVTSSDSKTFRGMLKLNKSGAFVFGLMQNEFTAEEIAEQLAEKYDIDKSAAIADCNEFIEIFKNTGLIENE